MEKQTMGGFLATLRKANGYTQAEVAEKLGVSNKTLSSWETDKTCPDLTLIPVLADLYGVTSDEILRAERRRPDGTEGEKDGDREAANAKKVRALLRKQERSFKNRNYILRGVSVGVWILLLAAVLLVGVARVVFAVLFAVGMVTVIVLLHVFSENALGFVPDGEECGRPEDLAAYRKDVYLRKYRTAVFFAMPLFVLALCVPLFFAFAAIR